MRRTKTGNSVETRLAGQLHVSFFTVKCMEEPNTKSRALLLAPPPSCTCDHMLCSGTELSHRQTTDCKSHLTEGLRSSVNSEQFSGIKCQLSLIVLQSNLDIK